MLEEIGVLSQVTALSAAFVTWPLGPGCKGARWGIVRCRKQPSRRRSDPIKKYKIDASIAKEWYVGDPLYYVVVGDGLLSRLRL